MANIQLRNVTKSYGSVTVIKGIDLEIRRGEFMVFVGPSGCGKSTLLRLISGLESISTGDLYFDGERVNNVIPSKRGIAMVFQSYALFPHMTVAENVAFGLEMKKVPKDEIGKRVAEALDMVRLSSYGERKPRQMSGGQQQRVGVARALAADPPVLLMDEPYSAVDPIVRAHLQDELLRLQEQVHKTIVLVTHDIDEAIKLADRIAILHEGRIIANGTLAELRQLLPPAKVEYVEKQPTLEDVFIAITGTTTEEQP